MVPESRAIISFGIKMDFMGSGTPTEVPSGQHCQRGAEGRRERRTKKRKTSKMEIRRGNRTNDRAENVKKKKMIRVRFELTPSFLDQEFTC